MSAPAAGAAQPKTGLGEERITGDADRKQVIRGPNRPDDLDEAFALRRAPLNPDVGGPRAAAHDIVVKPSTDRAILDRMPQGRDGRPRIGEEEALRFDGIAIEIAGAEIPVIDVVGVIGDKLRHPQEPKETVDNG